MKPPETLTFSQRYEKHLYEKGVDNDQLLKVFNITQEYLGIKTVKQYAMDQNTSLQNVYQNKEVSEVLGVKVVFDND